MVAVLGPYRNQRVDAHVYTSPGTSPYIQYIFYTHSCTHVDTHVATHAYTHAYAHAYAHVFIIIP